MKKNITSWIFPANPRKFEVLGAFAKYGQLDWGTKNKVEVDDEVYIYLGDPIGKIILKTVVIKVDIEDSELIDDDEFNIGYGEESDDNCSKKYIRLELIQSFLTKKDYLAFNTLKEHGLKSKIQGSIKLNNNMELMEYIRLVEV